MYNRITLRQLQRMAPSVSFEPSFKLVVPNPWAVDLYRSVGHLILGRTERISNLHHFVLFII